MCQVHMPTNAGGTNEIVIKLKTNLIRPIHNKNTVKLLYSKFQLLILEKD